ncbi:MAG: DUF5011 domain-containing protein [Acidobacteria bacterium]|nr:DUF5011 domain-containing protein [Acidobacteriota bacterium]
MKAITRARFLILLVAVLSVPLISAASASYARRSSAKSTAPSAARFQPLAAAPLFQAAESVATYASDCTTPKTSFNLGDAVCAKVTGAPTGVRATQLLRRLVIVGPDGFVRDKVSVPGNGSTATLSFTIPTSATTLIGLDTVDNRGTWQAVSVKNDGSPVIRSEFTVKDPASQVADLLLGEAASVTEVAPGSNITFRAYLSNRGPDDAADVVFTTSEPANASFVSASAGTGSGFTCNTSSGTTTCSADSLPAGTRVAFTLTYDVSGAAPAGSLIVSSSSATTSTAQRSSSETSASAAAVVSTVAPPTACNLTCPANVVATANTTVGGNFGAFVTFSSASVSGDCGAVSNSPASGTFFPVGTTTVTSSASGDNGAAGDSCTFTVKVVGTAAPTISCPADKTAIDTDNNGSETVSVGTPTFTASSAATVHGVRSDSIPAVYDDQGNLVSPAQEIPLTDPYPVGITGITWTVTDADGRTVSCTQRITVSPNTCGSDTTPPTITAPDDVTVGTGAINPGCTVVLDDELGQPVFNDDECAVTVTITGAPAGNAFAPGTYTLTYTATNGKGLTASDTQVVTVVDDTPPIIAAPPDATYTCLSEVPAASTSQAKGPVVGPDGQFVRDASGDLVFSGPPFENCGAVNVSVNESATGVGSAANPRVITRTFTATDARGNSASAVQTITVADPTPPVITLNGAAAVTVECHTSFTDPGATATDNCGTANLTVSGSVGVNTPGTYTLTYNATDAVGNAATPKTRTVTVVDTIAPTITVNGLTPSLWPANHKYKTFALTDFVTGVSDSCNTTLGVSSVVIEKVTSDEIENGNGDGNTTNDIVIGADCKSFQVRAERDGGGNGRVYTVTFKVTDASGNVGRTTATIVVPHNPGETPVNSGVHYTVNGSCP